jgi:hypothetical protein
VEYSKNKTIQKVVPKGRCGSCYCVYTHETFTIKLDVLIRTSILDIKQQDEVERCISDSFNVVKIPKAIVVLLIVDVAKKRANFQNKAHN